MVLGHEGAGIVEEVGPGVTRVAPGDRVVCSFIPNCGVCRYCATGRQSICDWGAGTWAVPARSSGSRSPAPAASTAPCA